MITNRTLEEKQIARNIYRLKQKQKDLRARWLNIDTKINELKNKISECTIKRMSRRTKPKLGDFYNDKS